MDKPKSSKKQDNEIKHCKKLLRHYKTSEKKYKTLYEESPDLYRTVDMNGIILDCNHSYSEYLRYSRKDIIGKSVFDHTAQNSLKIHKEGFNKWKKNPVGKVVQAKEIYLKKRNGETFPALLNSTNIYNKKKLVGIHTLIRDITDFVEAQRKAEEQKILEMRLKEIEEVDKLKSEFASMVTHELKTPLAPIIGHCDMLKEPELLGTLNPDQLEAVIAIHRNAKRLEKLIGDVLDSQKLELRKMKFNKERFLVTNFMYDMTRNLMSLMRDKHIKFTNITNVDEKLTIYGDASKLIQVLTNLVENSVDFIPKENGVIEIGAIEQDKHVLFHVKDNGIGIPKDKQVNLFKKFYQVDTSTGRKHGGSGLGLAICKGIVEELGGDIWIKSEEGKGATFYYTVPKHPT